jgi:hypothetical protein
MMASVLVVMEAEVGEATQVDQAAVEVIQAEAAVEGISLPIEKAMLIHHIINHV